MQLLYIFTTHCTVHNSKFPQNDHQRVFADAAEHMKKSGAYIKFNDIRSLKLLQCLINAIKGSVMLRSIVVVVRCVAL